MRIRARLPLGRLAHEDGFTIVEAMVSISILAIAAFTIAQSITFGLKTSGMSRQRLAARAAAEQQMELARALNYDSIVLGDSSAISHSSDTTHPDYWVDQAAQTFDPEGSQGPSSEEIVRVANASPSLRHVQAPFTTGNTTFEIYLYVTWVDAASDGVGGDDDPDGNADDLPDANGQDQKRVTVAVRWRDGGGSTWRTEWMSSLFSDGKVNYRGEPGSLSSPTATPTEEPTPSPTPPVGDPAGSVLILGGSTYATELQVTLTLSSVGATQMQFSNDGATWSDPEEYGESTIYTLPSGEGPKTVYAKFFNGEWVGPVFDTIVLDTTPPSAPSGLIASSKTSGATKTITLTWSPPFPLGSDFEGYRVARRLTTSSHWEDLSCGSGTTCADIVKKQDAYEYYVVAYDLAGNESAESNHVTA